MTKTEVDEVRHLVELQEAATPLPFILFVREMLEQGIDRSIVIQVLEKPSHWELELKHYVKTGRLPWAEE